MLFGIAAIADHFIAYDPSFPYVVSELQMHNVPRWIYSFANFDGVHYLTIAREGYMYERYIQAFFPFYPFVLLHSLHLIFPSIDLLIAGLVISNLACLGFFILWFYFVKALSNEKTAWTSLGVLFLFPTSFFLGSLYTESLFLLFATGAFFAAHKKVWWLTGLMTLLACATRLVGIFIVPAIVIDIYMQTKRLPKFSTLLWIGIGSLGLLSFMAYLDVYFHDPLFFLHVQPNFGAGRTSTLVLYPQVVWRAMKILLTAHDGPARYFIYIEEFVTGTVGLLGTILSFQKKHLGLWLFGIGAFLLPTFTGTFSSMPRYILVVIPLFIWIAEHIQQRLWVKYLYFIISAILLVLNFVLFIQGYWVA